MRKVFLYGFIQTVAVLVIWAEGVDIQNRLHAGGYSEFDRYGWYDAWIQTTATYESDHFGFKNKLIGGFSQDVTYAATTFFIEAGIPEIKFGFKTTLQLGDETGGAGKYGYPPLKELPTIFFLEDFAYRDRFTILQNGDGVNELVPISTMYMNMQVGKLCFRTRTVHADPENRYAADVIRKLEWFKDFTFETVYGTEDISGGIYFMTGSVLDYTFKNIDRDLNEDGFVTDDKYKDTLVLGGMYKKLVVNAALYNYNQYYYSALRYTISQGGHDYSVYAEANTLNNVATLFLTQDYRRDLYGSVNYKRDDDTDWFFAAADTETIGDLSLTALVCYRKILSEDILYEGFVGSITGHYTTKIGIFTLSAGSTQFSTVWEAWQVFPNNSGLVVSAAYEIDF